jgi:hypothetical protein
VVLVDHTQSSQGFTGGLTVGVREAKARGGDEPGVHIRVASAFSTKTIMSHRRVPLEVYSR